MIILFIRPEHVTRAPTNGSAVLLSRISFIYTFWYNFDTILCQFLETVTSNRFLICILQFLRFSGLILYPLSFFLYSPFNIDKKAQLCGGDQPCFFKGQIICTKLSYRVKNNITMYLAKEGQMVKK